MLSIAVKVFALSAMLASAFASDINERIPSSGLGKRQQFIPTTSTASGSTCVEAFGQGYLTCREKTDTRNRLCYNPTQGDTCCESSWACPADSFCLVSPYCCPTGLDANTCASQFGVRLSSDFKKTSTSGPATSTVAAAAVTTAPYPLPTHNMTYPTASSPFYSSMPPMFTGGANAQAGLGYVAAIGGLLGLAGAVL